MDDERPSVTDESDFLAVFMQAHIAEQTTLIMLLLAARQADPEALERAQAFLKVISAKSNDNFSDGEKHLYSMMESVLTGVYLAR